MDKGRVVKYRKRRPDIFVVVIDEEKRILKNKTSAIKKVCRELEMNFDKLIEPNINSIEILKDLGKTAYDID